MQMKWDQYRSVMEQHVIKTDDMATEDAYFMATHMPFSQLEVIEGGQTATPPEYIFSVALMDFLSFTALSNTKTLTASFT